MFQSHHIFEKSIILLLKFSFIKNFRVITGYKNIKEKVNVYSLYHSYSFEGNKVI